MCAGIALANAVMALELPTSWLERLPSDLVRKMKLNRVRVYFAADNIWVWWERTLRYSRSAVARKVPLQAEIYMMLSLLMARFRMKR